MCLVISYIAGFSKKIKLDPLSFNQKMQFIYIDYNFEMLCLFFTMSFYYIKMKKFKSPPPFLHPSHHIMTLFSFLLLGVYTIHLYSPTSCTKIYLEIILICRLKGKDKKHILVFKRVYPAICYHTVLAYNPQFKM